MKPRAILLALLATLGFGCNRDRAAGTLLIAGSSALHAYLEPVVEAFKKKHPNTEIVNEEGGGTAAIIALKRGAIGVATVGRDVNADEDEMALRSYLVAREGVVIVVNSTNPVNDIALHDLTRVFDGTVTSWRDLPQGAAGAITIVVRDKRDTRKNKPSTTRQSFDDKVMSGDDPARGSQLVGSSDEMKAAITRNPLAIGYVMLKDLTGDVKPLAVDGVLPNRITILSERYPLTRSYYLMVMRPSKLAEEFVSFTLGRAAQDILREDGLIPVF